MKTSPKASKTSRTSKAVKTALSPSVKGKPADPLPPDMATPRPSAEAINAQPAAPHTSRPPKVNSTAKHPPAHAAARPAKTGRPLSALDAAAQVIAEAKSPLRSIDMIQQMENRKLWTSPGGKTPEATLYAAIVREITAKGKLSRFKKHDRGLFVAGKTAA